MIFVKAETFPSKNIIITITSPKSYKHEIKTCVNLELVNLALANQSVRKDYYQNNLYYFLTHI